MQFVTAMEFFFFFEMQQNAFYIFYSGFPRIIQLIASSFFLEPFFRIYGQILFVRSKIDYH